MLMVEDKTTSLVRCQTKVITHYNKLCYILLEEKKGKEKVVVLKKYIIDAGLATMASSQTSISSAGRTIFLFPSPSVTVFLGGIYNLHVSITIVRVIIFTILSPIAYVCYALC